MTESTTPSADEAAEPKIIQRFDSDGKKLTSVLILPKGGDFSYIEDFPEGIPEDKREEILAAHKAYLLENIEEAEKTASGAKDAKFSRKQRIRQLFSTKTRKFWVGRVAETDADEFTVVIGPRKFSAKKEGGKLILESQKSSSENVHFGVGGGKHAYMFASSPVKKD